MYRMILCATAAVLAAVAFQSASADDHSACDQSRGDDAIAACGRLLALDPRDTTTYNNRGFAYNAEGDRAIADLDQAIRLDAKNAVTYVTRGEANDGKNDPGGAMVEFEHALRLDPSLAEARKGRERVQVRMAKGPSPGASTAPLSSAPSAQSGGSSADIAACRSLNNKDLGQRLEACTRAIVANPRNNDILLPAYLARATLYQGLKEWDHVIADCDEILRLAPEGDMKSAAGGLRDAALRAKTPAPAVAQNPSPGSGSQWQSLSALNHRLLEAMKAGDYGLDITRVAEEAVKRSRAAFGDRDPGDTLTTINNLALLYTYQGRYSEAEPLYLEALQGTREAKGDRNPSTLTSISNLASLYDAEGRYEESERLAREVLQTRREVLGARHPDTLTSLNNLANIYLHQGRFSEAEPLFVEVLQAQREVQGARHPNTLASINNLAVLYEDEGRYGEGEQLERAGLEERREALGARHPDTLRSLSNLALLYWGQRRYEEAEPLFREALQARREVLGARHPDTLISLNNLAAFYDDQGRFGEAEPLDREVLQTRREVLGARHPDTLQSLNNLAWDSVAQGRFGEAEPLFREALQASREVLGARHPATLNIVSGLAILYDREGRNSDAEPLYRESLQAGREVLGARHPATLNFQGLFAVYLAKANRTTEAVRLLQEMEPDVLGRIGQELHRTETGTARRRLLSSLASFQDTVLTLAVAPDASLDARRFAATTVLQFKVLQGEEEAYLARLARRSSDPRVQALVTEIGRLRVTLAALAQGAPEAFAKTLQALEAKQQELVSLSPEYSERLQVLRAGLDEVRKALPAGGALIEFRQFRPYDFQAKKQGEPRFAAVLLTGTTEPVIADLGPVSELQPLAAALGGGTEGRGPAVQEAPESPFQATASRGLAPAGQQPSQSNEAVALYQRLLGPFKDAVAAAKTVYVAPDGILNLMPFARLKLADGRYWFEAQEVHVLQTGRDLLRPGADHAARGMIALGGINFNAGAAAAGKLDSAFFAAARSDRKAAVDRAAGVFRIGFPALPATAAEAKDVTAAYRKRFADEPAELWSGADASKDRLMALKAPPRVLHLATHGFYLPNQSREPMLLSGIALSGANREVTGSGNEGLLFALEAEGLNLDGTELVVLSACDTAKGDVDYSEGVFGLARALRTAGARNVLVTLWPLDDLLARDFMADFYKNWLSTARSDPARALRDTQLQWIKQAGRSDPGAWAPYVVVE